MPNPILKYQPAGGVTRSVGPVITSTSCNGDDEGTPILGYQPGGGPTTGSRTKGQRQGYLYYWPDIDNLTGGIHATDLDAQDISILPSESLIIVITGVDGDETHWRRMPDASSPVTNLGLGIIVPTNYDSVTRPWVLLQELTGGGDGDGAVSSVFGRIGDVVALTDDYAAFYQPLDSDLTAIAALTTTSFGRGSLVQADAAAFRTYIGAGTSSATPGGSNTYVQYNNSGVFGGASNFTYNGTQVVTPAGSFPTPGLAIGAADVGIVNTGSNNYYVIGGDWHMGITTEGLSLNTSRLLKWYNDVAISRNAAGVLEVNNGTAGTYRDLIVRNISPVAGVSLGIGATNGPWSIGNGSVATTAGSLAIGYAATATLQSLCIGYAAGASGGTNASTLLGFNAQGAANSVVIGSSASAGINSFALGSGANASGVGSVAMGYNTLAPVGNIFVSGADLVPVNNVYFGKGYVNATPTVWTLNGTGGSGTDIAGGDLAIAGGRGTGTGAGGSILFQTATAGITGTGLNTLTTRLTLSTASAAFTVPVTGSGTVPTGGATGQVLSKIDGTNYNLQWINPVTGGGGDVFGAASSVDSQIALFSGTGGKTIKVASTTGILKASSGVIAAAVAGTDYQAAGAYLTANQNISLTGDVTGGPAATSIATTIGANKVTLGMMATMATDSILGRATALTGNVEVLAALPWADTGDVTRAADGKVTVLANFPAAVPVQGVAPTRGDIIYYSASGWAKLGIGSAGTFLKAGGVGTDPSWAAAGGSGTVTDFSAGDLSPLFTTTEATTTTTPALSFALRTDTAANTVYGRAAGTAGAASFSSSPQFLAIGNLTTNGFVKTTAGTGTLSVDTATYLTTNQLINLTGDVTGGGTTAITTTIGANKVTYAMMQDVTATSRFLGRITAGAGDPEELTGTQATTLLDLATSALKGLVPASGGGTTNFLRADMTWNVPAGGGNVSNSGSPTVDQFGIWVTATTIKGVTAAAAKTLLGIAFTDITGTATDAQVPDTLTVNAISNLTTNGFVKTGGGVGTLSVDTATYLTTATAASTYQPLDADLTSWAAITRGSGIDAFIATPNSANLRAVVTDETGTSGGLVFAGSPTITTPTIAALANLTSNGFVKTSGGIGTLSIDTTTYEPTLGNPSVSGYILSSTTGGVRSWIVPPAGGGGTSMSSSITQTTHGFAVGNVIKYTGTAYAKAQADTAANAEVVGLVTVVTDANNFTLTTGGAVTGLSGLTAGSVYFLSNSTAGLLTTTAPVLNNEVSKPLLVATSTTGGYFFNWRGWVISGSVGTVTNFSAGDLSPLFTTIEATTTTTPALSFALRTDTAANTVYGNATGSAGAASFSSSPRFTAIGNLTTNGFIKTGGGVGTLSVDTATYEPALGNPGTSGYVLSSTTGGVRSWIAPTTGGGGAPVGTDKTFQYNNAGAFGSVATMVYDSGTTTITQIGNAMWNLVDNVDLTKKAKFDVSNIATATTRTVNIPNANSTTIQADTGSANNFLTAVSAQGVISKARPAFTDISGSVAATQMPALTGDVTTSAGAVATTLTNIPLTTKINGVTPTRGDVLYYGASGWAKLAAGTSGNQLTTNGAGADPTWAAPGSGGGGTPAGSFTQLQYNNSGSFGGVTGGTWDGTTFTVPGQFTVSGSYAAGARTTVGFMNSNATNKSSQFSFLSAGATQLWSVVNDLPMNGTQDLSFYDNVANSPFIYLTGTDVRLPTTKQLAWGTISGGQLVSPDTGLARNAAGVVEVNNGTVGSYRDLKLRTLLFNPGAAPTGVEGALYGNSTDHKVYYHNGTSFVDLTAGGAGGTPGGSTTQVQFNDGGAFGGDSDFVWDKTNNNLTITSSAPGTGLQIKATAASTNSPQLGYFDGVTQKGFLGLALSAGHFDTGSGAGDLVLGSGPANRLLLQGTSGIAFSVTSSGGTIGMTLQNTGVLDFGSSHDVGIVRNAGGVLEINNGTAGTYRDLKLRTLLLNPGAAPTGVEGALYGDSTNHKVYYYNGTSFVDLTAGGAGGTPGGSTLQLEYNNAGAFGGMSGTSWDDTNRSLTLTGATVTTSKPIFDLAQTWNASGIVFTGLKVNVTNTASAAGSALADFQTGTVSQTKIRHDGFIDIKTGIGIPSVGSYVYDAGDGYLTILAGGSGLKFVQTGNYFTNQGSTFIAANNSQYGWQAAGQPAISALDTALARNAGGVVEVNNGTAGTYRDLKARTVNVTTDLQVNGITTAADYLNSSVSSQSPSTSDVYLTGSNVVVPAGGFKAKGQYRCIFDVVKSAGTGAIVLTLRIGTAGTTADTSRITFTFGSGTSVADTGTFEVCVNWRTVGSGTSAVVSGFCRAQHNLATTGLFNNAAVWTIVGTVSGGFDSSAATNMGLSFNGATTFAGTITTVQATLAQ